MIKICYCGERGDVADRLENIMAEEGIFPMRIFFRCGSAEEIKGGEGYDVIFLEVDGSYSEAAERINHLLPRCFLIFVSDDNSYAVSSYDHRAFHYLLTDDSRDRYLSVLLSLYQAYTERHGRYIIECRQGPVCVELSEIYYVEYIDKHTVFYTVSGSYSVRQTIGVVAAELVNLGFIQTHQGFIVNMKRIRSIPKNEVILTDGTSVMMSQRRRREVLEGYRRYMKNIGGR